MGDACNRLFLSATHGIFEGSQHRLQTLLQVISVRTSAGQENVEQYMPIMLYTLMNSSQAASAVAQSISAFDSHAEG